MRVEQLFSGGIEVGAGILNLDQTVALTRQALEHRRPLFEAAFAAATARARSDILNPVGADRWDLFEVKVSTSAKPVCIHGIAHQVRVLRDAGIAIRKCFVVYINKDYVRQGDLAPEQSFVREDVTDAVDELLSDVEDNLYQMHRAVDLLTPFNSIKVYNTNQRGSASTKAVLPAFTGRSNRELEIQEGGTASLEYVRANFGDASDEERQRVRRQLEEYCGRDTEGMVWLVAALQRFSLVGCVSCQVGERCPSGQFQIEATAWRSSSRSRPRLARLRQFFKELFGLPDIGRHWLMKTGRRIYNPVVLIR